MTIKAVSVEPHPELWYHSSFALGPAIEIGRTSSGWRRIVPITGGTFEGQRLAGRVLPGGADWQRLREDGVLEARARYVLETRDGARIDVENAGLLHAPPDVMAQLASGDAPPPESYYFRSTPRFETAHPSYLWLSRQIAVACGEVSTEGIHISVYGL